MIERKLAAGIETTIVGSPVGAGAMVPIPGVDNYAQTESQLAAFHDWLARTCAEHPGRLKAYVYTNPFGGDALLAAAATTLQADDAFVGFIVNTSVNGEFLGSERSDQFFAMASELRAPVLLHPPADRPRWWAARSAPRRAGRPLLRRHDRAGQLPAERMVEPTRTSTDGATAGRRDRAAG